MWRWSGLRARVAANLAATVSLTFGLLAFTLMAIMQHAVRQAEQAGISIAADLVTEQLAGCANDPRCYDNIIASTRRSGIVVELRLASLPAPGKRSQGWHSVERHLGEFLVEIQLPPGPIVERARAALTALLICLAVNGVALVIIGTVLFERGVVSRLTQVDEDMSRIERLELETPLLTAPGGDEIGRMAGTLNRIAQRLREDKRRTTEYIGQLERTNRELRETREGLARTERLATVGRLAAGVAHEIGNPVAAIVGYLEILKSSQATETDEYLQRIGRETQRVDRIVRDLLDFARPRPLAIAPVSIGQVIDSAARLVEPQPRWRSMSLIRKVDGDLRLVAAQEHYATQVLVNLLINAADACRGSGVVTVTARNAEQGRVVIEVADDGPGIRPEDLTRVFDPFFTTKAPGEGVGLGLSISHRLMESFGGEVSVDKVDPHGAVFTLTFQGASPS